jgi:hypothetical protein
MRFILSAKQAKWTLVDHTIATPGEDQRGPSTSTGRAQDDKCPVTRVALRVGVESDFQCRG